MRFIERIKRGHRYFVVTRRDYIEYLNPYFGEYAISYMRFMVWFVIRNPGL
jgi:hypothetical protein